MLQLHCRARTPEVVTLGCVAIEILNVVFLMWIAVLPFPTALLARYLEHPSEQHTATAIYAGAVVVGSVLFNLLWRYAVHHDRLLGEEVDRQAIQKTTRSYTVGPVLYLVDFALSYVSPPASLALFFLLALFYAISPLLLLDRWLGWAGEAETGHEG